MSFKEAVTEDWISRRIFGATSNLLPGAPPVVRSSNRHVERALAYPADSAAARKRMFSGTLLAEIAQRGGLNTQPHPFAPSASSRPPHPNVPRVNSEQLLHHAANGPGLNYGEAQLPSVLGPRAKRLLLALVATPPLAYGAHKAYQHFRSPANEEATKEAALARYGLRKEALSPMARNMLIGAGLGGAITGGVNYYHHHDKPDAFSRAAKATGAGAAGGAIVGGLLTPARAPRPAPREGPDSPERRLAQELLRAHHEGDYHHAATDLKNHLLDGFAARPPLSLAERNAKAQHFTNEARSIGQEEFDRLMVDPNHVWQF